MRPINTTEFSISLRNKGIDRSKKSILITNFHNTLQEKDLTIPPNCNGFGRIRHFKMASNENWQKNPLPILPALNKLGMPNQQEITAQIFQNAVCNWRCWYCFVDFKLLSANPKYSKFLSCSEMVTLYMDQSNPPPIIDLSGGQPDLTPEWIPWMMEELIERNIHNKTYLWSDDNLSNDYFWQFLSDKEIELVQSYENYGRVCCFKGIDKESFALNTQADPELFDNQFILFERLMRLGIDLYAYITLPAKLNTNFDYVIPQLIDKLQNIHENLPLRIIPLKVFEFTPVAGRMKTVFENMILGQEFAYRKWSEEIRKRFNEDLINQKITSISLNNELH